MAGEWRPVTLGDVLSFTNGRASPERSDSLPYPVYGSNGVIGFASETNANNNIIVIGRVGSYCGSLYLSAQKCWVTDNAIRASALDDNDAGFLFYLLRTLDLNHWRAGSGQPLLNQTILSQIPASIPLPDEQRAIAHVLGTLDDKIELNRRMNEMLEAMAQAIFKSWFVDVTENGIPKGWTAGTLGDVAENPRRTVDPSEVEPETPYIGLEHMPRRSIALAEWGRAGDVASGKARFIKREILLGKLRPYFHKVGVAVFDGVCSTDILTVRPKAVEWHSFVLCHLSSNDVIDYADACSTGTKMPRVSWTDLARYEVALPPAELAAKFNANVQPMFNKITANIGESRTLAAIRDALLPKLLSGEIRVKNVKSGTAEGR